MSNGYLEGPPIFGTDFAFRRVWSLLVYSAGVIFEMLMRKVLLDGIRYHIH